MTQAGPDGAGSGGGVEPQPDVPSAGVPQATEREPSLGGSSPVPPAGEGAPPSRVFISHSSRDAASAMQIVGALELGGVGCWVAPRDIPPGADYNDSIMIGLGSVAALVLVYSRHAVGSDPVKREVERALNRKLPVIPVRLEVCPPSPALEFMISTSQWVDAFPPPLERHLEDVVAAVRRALNLARISGRRRDRNGVPEYVGPYRILEKLGEGGMGTVYKAEQRSPVRRTVALKLIKLGMDTREVVARFESERQALARMDHPNVAKVLDAGADEVGRPYFVMEYVPGTPITRFADEQRLTVRQRLALFVQTCDAIAHAHTKALIHRDVKASNVLAYLADTKPVVKVIDFGIAKALTGDRLTDRTFNTERGQALGTYEAMSPEQADGSPDIDTRTDVYSLGVLLYELLAGANPFDKAELARAADAEVRRIIREVEPPRPSTRLSALKGDAGTRAAAARKGQLDALARELRSELEWIPLKAMRKERARRYDSPQQLAEDIGRYLDGKPLIAGPESVGYRARKFVRRNRLAIASVSGVLLALAAGTVISTQQALRASRAERAVSQQLVEVDRRRRDAVEANGRADAEARKLRLELSNRFIEQGLDAWTRERFATAALWFYQALKLDEGDPARQVMQRRRIAASLNRCTGLADVPEEPSLRWVKAKKRAFKVSDEDPVQIEDPIHKRVIVLPVPTKSVMAEAVSPDGVRVATGLADGNLTVWDAATDAVVARLAHPSLVFRCCFSNDGTKLATVTMDGTARLWDLQTAAQIGQPLRHAKSVNQITWSADDSRVLTASSDETAQIWSSATGEPLGEPMRHAGNVNAAVFNSAGTLVATASNDRTARIWDAFTGAPVTAPLEHGTEVEYVQFSAGDRCVQTVTDIIHTRVWKIAPNRALRSMLEVGAVANQIVLSPDEKTLVTEEGTRARIRDAATGAPIGRPLVHRGFMWTVCYSPDGRYLLTASTDNTAQRWDARTGLPAGAPMAHDGSVTAARFGSDGRRIATASGDGTARVWDAETGQPISPPLKQEGVVWDAAFSADGMTLMTGGPDARLWALGADAASPSPREWKSRPVNTDRLTLSPDGQSIMSSSGPFRLYDARDMHVLFERTSLWMNLRACFSGDGSRIATVDKDATRIVDARTGAVLSPMIGNGEPPTAIALNRDGSVFAAAGLGEPCNVWEAATARLLAPPFQQAKVGRSVAISSDAHSVYAGSADGALRRWSVGTEYPDGGGDDDALTAAMLMSGMKVDPAGGLSPLSAGSKEWEALWNQFRTRHAAELKPSDNDLSVLLAEVARTLMVRGDALREQAGSGKSFAAIRDEPAPASPPEESQANKVALAEAERLFRLALQVASSAARGDPQVEHITTSLSGTLARQGKTEEAIAFARDAVRLAEESTDRDEGRVIEILNRLGKLLNQSHDAEGLFACASKAVDLAKAAPAATAAQADESYWLLAVSLSQRKDLPGTIAAMRESLLLRQQGRHSMDAVFAMRSGEFASALFRAGQFPEAEKAFRESLERYKGLAPFANKVWQVEAALARTLAEQGKLEEAESLYRSSLARRRASLKQGDKGLIQPLENLGQLLIAADRYADADPVLREALDIRRANFQPDDPELANALVQHSVALARVEQFPQAEAELREALSIQRKALPAGHPQLVQTVILIGNVLQMAERFAEAAPVYREAIDMERKRAEPDEGTLSAALVKLAEVEDELDHLADAEAACREALALIRKRDPKDSRAVAEASQQLGFLLLQSKRGADAEPLFREALGYWRGQPDAPAMEVAEAASGLGRCLALTKKDQEAEPILRDALAAFEKEHEPAENTANALADLLDRTGRPDEAKAVRAARDAAASKGEASAARPAMTRPATNPLPAAVSPAAPPP